MVQRGEHGQLKKGSVLNPKGRSKRATEEAYLDILKKEVTVNDWREIVQKAIIDAKRGDSVARKFLADYIIGTPIQNVSANVNANISNTPDIKGVDYRTVAATLAPGPVPDSDPSSEDQGSRDGSQVG